MTVLYMLHVIFSTDIHDELLPQSFMSLSKHMFLTVLYMLILDRDLT